MIYAVLSDIHAHNWSMYSHTNSNGINSRLQVILDEMIRAACEVKKLGGSHMVIAGDIMHQRGQIDPEVLNPMRDTVEKILGMGIDILAIPGNHDLKSADTCELSSSIQNLAQVTNKGNKFEVMNEACIHWDARMAKGVKFAFVPWRHSHDDLLNDIKSLADSEDPSMTDLFIHAGIDGVLSGMPASGLTHTVLGAFGFRRVFAGHYHNHMDFGNGVVSIGATTHHNWGDVGTRAGFLIVDGSTGAFSYNASHAPKFTDVSGYEFEEIQLEAPGNFVRFRGAPMDETEKSALQQMLNSVGAKGVSVEVATKTAIVRGSNPTGKAKSAAESIKDYVKDVPPTSPLVKPEDVIARAIDVLNLVQAVND